MSRTIPSLFYDFLSLLNRIDSSFSPFRSSKKFLEYFVIKNYQKNKIWYIKSGLVIMSVFLLLSHYLSTGWHVLMDPAYMIFSMLSHLRSGSSGKKLIKLVAESLRKAFYLCLDDRSLYTHSHFALVWFCSSSLYIQVWVPHMCYFLGLCRSQALKWETSPNKIKYMFLVFSHYRWSVLVPVVSWTLNKEFAFLTNLEVYLAGIQSFQIDPASGFLFFFFFLFWVFFKFFFIYFY